MAVAKLVVFKTNPKTFHSKTSCWSFRVGLNENASSYFATRCRFWGSKDSGFPGNAVRKAALHSQMLLYQALQV